MTTDSQILGAALQLFHDEGVGVSTAKIAAAAGVSNGTLFHHFPTKQALLDALYLAVKTDLAAAIGTVDAADDLQGQVRTVVRRWARWSKDHPVEHRVTRLLLESGLASAEASARADALFTTSQRLLERARAERTLVDLPQTYVAGLLHAHVELVVACDLDAEQQERAFTSLWMGLLAASNTTSI